MKRRLTLLIACTDCTFTNARCKFLVSSRPLQEGVEEMKKENGRREEMESKAPGFESMSSAFAEKTLEETTQSMPPLRFGAIGFLIVSIGLPRCRRFGLSRNGTSFPMGLFRCLVWRHKFDTLFIRSPIVTIRSHLSRRTLREAVAHSLV